MCECSCALKLTSFKELSVQVRQATSDGVSQSTAVHPVVGLAAQVATQRALGRRNGRHDDRRQGHEVKEGRRGNREQGVTERNR